LTSPPTRRLFRSGRAARRFTTRRCNVLAVRYAGGRCAYISGSGEYDWSHDGRSWYSYDRSGRIHLRARAGHPDRLIYVAPAGVHCHFPVWVARRCLHLFRLRNTHRWWSGISGEFDPQALGSSVSRLTTLTWPTQPAGRTDYGYLATSGDGSGPWLYTARH